MSSATADSYPESVGSCRPPSPPTPTPAPPPPAPAAHRGAPVRRQLDFTDADAGAGAGGDLELDEFILSAMDDIERGYSEAKVASPAGPRAEGAAGPIRDPGVQEEMRAYALAHPRLADRSNC